MTETPLTLENLAGLIADVKKKKKTRIFEESTPLDLIQKYAKAQKKEPCQVRLEFAAAVEHYEQISYKHSGPEFA